MTATLATDAVTPTNLPPRQALASLLDGVDDAMLLFDDLGRVSFSNRAAMRLLAAEPGQTVAQLARHFSTEAGPWLRAALTACTAQDGPATEARFALADGRAMQFSAWPSERGMALRLRLLQSQVPAAALQPPRLGSAATQELLQLLWASPFPATLQGGDYRLVAVNDAYLKFTGLPRDQLIGRDPVSLQPREDHAAHLQARGGGSAAALRPEQRLIDARGIERWCRVSGHAVTGAAGELLRLVVLQDITAEHVARAQARRSLDELAQWFDFSPTGMLVFDERGLIVRSNAALEALVGQVPALMAQASAELQSLLAWEHGKPLPGLARDSAPLERQASLSLPDGRRRRLSARVRGFATAPGQQRYMAVVEDRSAEEERDLAQLEIGALMDAAGVGVATFDPARGWLRARSGNGEGGGGGAALQAVGRDMVEPESLPAYERLQAALRQGQPAEVRYAVRHPQRGERWLLTRVAPAELADGRRSVSVVTLDVTEQESAERRNAQLLRELIATLDGTTAGIAYLRGPRLVRCNRRFEKMLGFAPGALDGASLDTLFARLPHTLDGVRRAMAQGDAPPFEAELQLQDGPREGEGEGEDQVEGEAQTEGEAPWFSLSVRRTDTRLDGGQAEAVAVLSDITRLKAQQAELRSLLRDRELMFSLSDVGIAYLRGGRIERANQALAELTGYAEAELAALAPAELYPDAAAFLQLEDEERRVLRLRGLFRGERRLRRRDGSLLWVQVASRLVQEGQEDAGRICSYVNVDERYRARESLSEQAERTRAILDSVLVGIVTVGAGGIEWMNRSARRMFAGELADFVGEPISTVATPEPDHPLRRTHVPLAEGRAEPFECRLQARDGREFWVVGNVVATGRDGGESQRTFALLDIERRRQAEISIAQAQASLQRIIETAPAAIALFDARSARVLQLNQMAAQFFGQPMEQVMGRAPEDWCPPAVAARVRADLSAALLSSEVLRRETQQGSPAGNRLWDTRIVSLAATAGAAEQLLLVASDVTESRRAEQARFEAAIAQREMLVREVHHRIKNNLQGVAGLLQQNAERHPEVAGILGESVGQVQAIAQVYGLQVGVGGPLRADSVVQAIAQSVQRTFGRAVQVQCDAPALAQFVLPEAESIPVALTINELLTNAVKHSREGSVRCEVHTRGDELHILIANAGRLPAGFDLARFPGGVSGLGLVRALLPRRSASFGLAQQGDEVHTEVILKPPSVVRS